jgi:CRISPR/Cas system-associated exonuclease Cas4 (RecB family)
VSRIVPAAATPADSPDGGPEALDFLERAEVRDVLAWMRLLVDPQDASAVVRALARPPIELRQVDLARVIQVARRRKLDLVSGLAAATESPQVPPEARERIQRFVELHRSAAAGLDTIRPDMFVGRLIERLGTRHRALLVPEEAAAQRMSLARLRELAEEFTRERPRSTSRELARHLTVLAREPAWQERAHSSRPPESEQPQKSARPRKSEQLPESERPRKPDPEEALATTLEATLHAMREEVLASVARIGGRLGELRLDTDLDISHGIVRYLELLKLSALLQRPAGQSPREALDDVNARLLAATTSLQRDIFQTSSLDETLLAAAEGADSGEHGREGEHARAPARARSEEGPRIAQREEPSLGPFLPRKGVGLALSASDIDTYRGCPLRYKFARVLRIPTEQTLHQRFGIAVHQVLERYHSERGQTLARLMELLDAGWRRSGFGDSERERLLREKAVLALTGYHARLSGQDSEPVWFERAFSFRLGPHHLRGRVDRVDRLARGSDRLSGGEGEEEYELIDYKTSRPKTAEQLTDDVQLSLYALAAREDWQLKSSRQAYYYVLDDLKVPVPRGENDAEAVKDIVLEVGEGILGQRFEPTPSVTACSICDYRIVCPVAER